MEDYHLLPKLRDSLSYLYVEHAVLERRDGALLVLQETGKTAVPVANLCLLMLGPGTTVTHAAVKLLSENGTSILWTGEDMLHLSPRGWEKPGGLIIYYARPNWLPTRKPACRSC